MSQSAGPAAANDAPTRNEEQPELLTFTLQVVSPSVGVASPLSFPHLPATTSVKQLKAKIRDVLPARPADENQRLIHRGRMLARETETMLEVFSHETLGNPEPQTLHLVLRPSATDSSASLSAPIPGTPPLPFPPAPPLLSRSQPAPTIPLHGQQPLPGFQNVLQNQILHQAEQIHNAMAQRQQQFQRETQRLHHEMGVVEQRYRAAAISSGEHPMGIQNPVLNTQSLQFPRMGTPPTIPASTQNLIAQYQRELAAAAEGRQGTQDNGEGIANPGPSLSARASSIFRPDHTTTYTREGVGPNGERWHVTVNETTTTISAPRAGHQSYGGQNTNGNIPSDAATALRNSDRYQNQFPNMTAQQEARNIAGEVARQMRRENNLHLPTMGQPPVERGIAPSNTPGEVATPTTTNSSPSTNASLNSAANIPLQAFIGNPATNNNSVLSASNVPMVYILSSPAGPRGLLLTNSQSFFTPRIQRNRRHASPGLAPQGQALPQARFPVGLPEFRNRHVGRAARRNARQERENPLAPGDGAHAPLHANPHANPGAGALAAQAGPMLWLIVRLVGFIWFFTSGNPSWTRWLMVSGLAFIVFIINTGVFNNVAEQAWGPIRRHLENLVPLAGPDAALVPAANAAVPQVPGAAPPRENDSLRQGPHGELDPEQVAARLIEHRRQQNGGWLLTQIRRAEHSALLFVASLIPGVGERHIAAREAEATVAEVERQRLIDEAAATAENTEENVGGSNNGESRTEGPTEASDENQENQPPQDEGVAGGGAAAHGRPLIEV